jgi:hypothetical protein
MVEPGGELRQWLDAEHEHSVIERLHSVKPYPVAPDCNVPSVKPTWLDCRQREFRSNVSAHGRRLLAPNRVIGNTHSWPDP